jgi:hypothetical protein
MGWTGVKMKERLKIVLYSLCLAGCVGLALTMSIVVIASWTGGADGTVALSFNVFHERMIESIVFPVWTIMGFIASYGLLKIHCDLAQYKKMVEHLQEHTTINDKEYSPFWKDNINDVETPFATVTQEAGKPR